GARADEEVGQLHPLLVTAGAPVDVVGLGQLCDLGDPVEDPLVGRGLLGGCGSHAWLGPSRASRTPHAGGDRPPSVSAEWSLGATSPTPWMSGIGQYPHGFSGRAIGSIHAIHPRHPSTPSIHAIHHAGVPACDPGLSPVARVRDQSSLSSSSRSRELASVLPRMRRPEASRSATSGVARAYRTVEASRLEETSPARRSTASCWESVEGSSLRIASI